MIKILSVDKHHKHFITQNFNINKYAFMIPHSKFILKFPMMLMWGFSTAEVSSVNEPREQTRMKIGAILILCLHPFNLHCTFIKRLHCSSPSIFYYSIFNDDLLLLESLKWTNRCFNLYGVVNWEHSN